MFSGWYHRHGRSLNAGERPNPLTEQVCAGVPHSWIVVALRCMDWRGKTQLIAAPEAWERHFRRCVDCESKSASYRLGRCRGIGNRPDAQVEHLRLLRDGAISER